MAEYRNYCEYETRSRQLGSAPGGHMSSDVHHSGDQEEAHKCPVSDNEDSPVGESMFRCSDYSRPLASKEDTVVYYKKGDVGLAHVHRLDRRKLDNKLYKGLISCQTLELETIPTCRRVCRLVEETFVIDRGFSVGETVIKYENEFAGNPDKEYLCMPRLETAIGQVRGDVLVLPQKNLVVKNVPLGGNEYTEMVNYNSAHNYVMYKDWIGNASDCVNEVTLVYRGRHRFVVKEGGRSGVYLRRQDHADDGKALVPGECVSISVSEAIGRSATWENGPPKTLTASRRRRGVDSVKCVIEKVSTFKEFFADLTEQYGSRFQKLNAREVEALSTPCENCSKALQRELKQSTATAKNLGTGSIKAAKIARLSDYSPEQTKESECVSSRGPPSSEVPEAQGDAAVVDGTTDSSHDSSEDNDIPSNCGKSRVSVCRSIVRQKRTRKYPNRRRRCTPSLPVGCSRLAKDILGDGFIGEVLLSSTLVDVQWMDGTIERQIPGYMLIPHDPDLDQQDHLPGVIVARKDVQNAESTFGLILSTNRSERSCVVLWFERKENSVSCSDVLHLVLIRMTLAQVKSLGEEECLLFDIMPHPAYKRLFIGNYGFVIDQHHPSNDMRDIAFQVVADLNNGKQVSTTTPHLLLLPRNIHFVDESLDSDSDESSSITEVSTLDETTSSPLSTKNISNVLKSLGLFDDEDDRKNDVGKQTPVKGAVATLLKSFPELDNFSKKCSPRDVDAHTVQILFAGCVLKVDDYENHKVFDKFLYPNEHHVRQRHEIIASSLIEARQASRDHPELLAIFHCVTERLRNYKECGVRPPLRSKLHEFANSTSGFKPRHLSWEYIQSVADELLAIYCVCDEGSDPGPSKTKRKRASSGTSASSELPTFMLNLQATEREMAQGVDRTKLVISLIAQIMELPTSVMNKADSFTLYPNKDFATSHVPIEDRTNEAYNRKVRVPMAAVNLLCPAKEILKICSESTRWHLQLCFFIAVNCIYSDKYVAPSFIEYPTLHEIIAYVRSVDFHDPTPLKQLSIFTNTYSFDLIHSQVTEAYSKKMEEIGNTSNVNCNTFNEKERTVAAVPVAKQDTNKGTFMVLDECPAGGDSSDFAPSRKFYATVFKEHKMLTEHVPDSIHVHAFASRRGGEIAMIPGNICSLFARAAQSESVSKWKGLHKSAWYMVWPALILVPEPYYNEAGYESRKQQTEMADRSKRYNETATINSLEYLLKIYKDPPSDFKELVKEIVENEWPGYCFFHPLELKNIGHVLKILISPQNLPINM
ncbi:hypothetical protein ANCCEY_13036 [Ancylostoma ceylanicum]|uniref:Uncharacterized protein n=1 Tax=Ancylostoma ceylanicum TaxID=53326 RepID=A0A0D6LDD9_9BILA|nr:hypothetical protein ANCCEY_13036 [Ancylostoma ceylanicum]